jgi:hypothetical protein
MNGSVVIHAGARASGIRRSPIIRLAAAALLALCAAALLLLAAPPPGSAAPGDLLKLTRWLPQNDFTTYYGTRLVRGPGGDLWLGTRATLSATEPTYRNRVCVARFSPAGAKRWGRTMTTTVREEYFHDLAVDARGNAVVLAGTPSVSAKGIPWIVTKLGPTGKRLWRHVYWSPVNDSGWGGSRAIARDSHGAIYVAGTMKRAATGWDVAMMKLSPAGKRLWTRYVDGYEGGRDTGVDLAVDTRDRVYLTGTVFGLMSGTDILLARYTTAGKQVWKRTWDRGLGNDGATDLAVSSAGPAVSGTTSPTSDFDRGVVLHATPVMAQNAELEDHVLTRLNHDVHLDAVATNASGAVAAGGHAESYTAETGMYNDFTYARYRPGAADEVESYTSPLNQSSCLGVWLGSDSTLLATGGWEAAQNQWSAYLKSDAVAGMDWTCLPVYEGRQDIGHAVIATKTRAYMAGEAGDAIGLWVIER